MLDKAKDELPSIADVQQSADTRQIAIDKVGILSDQQVFIHTE